MELFNNLLMGLSTALEPNNLLFCLIGVVIGTAIGVLPGIGPIPTVALLLPFTFGARWPGPLWLWRWRCRWRCILRGKNAVAHAVREIDHHTDDKPDDKPKPGFTRQADHQIECRDRSERGGNPNGRSFETTRQFRLLNPENKNSDRDDHKR